MAFQIALADEGISFACAPAQTILDAAQCAGIELPYACRQGVCGNCAGDVVNGSATGTGGAPSTNGLCAPGQVLFCRSSPASDLVIRPRSWRRTDATGRRKLVAKVYRNTLAAPGISLLQLRLPAGQRIRFRAGQHLLVEMEGLAARHFSMANPPQESDAVTLHIRHLPGGAFTSRVPALVPGDTLRVEVPFGDFCVPDDEHRPLVFVATGTGFAPIKSIIDDTMKRGLARNMTLVWGVRSAGDLYMMSAVQAWQKRLPGFRFIPAISGGADAAMPHAFSGRVDAALRASFASLAGHAVYGCGSPEMIQSVLNVALEAGLAHADFHADAFVHAAHDPPARTMGP